MTLRNHILANFESIALYFSVNIWIFCEFSEKNDQKFLKEILSFMELSLKSTTSKKLSRQYCFADFGDISPYFSKVSINLHSHFLNSFSKIFIYRELWFLENLVWDQPLVKNWENVLTSDFDPTVIVAWNIIVTVSKHI